MPSSKEPNFEASMDKLSGIVEKMETGDLTLDESLKLYEEGIRISQTCMKRLEQAQQRIEMLMRTSSGDLAATEVQEETLKPRSKKKNK